MIKYEVYTNIKEGNIFVEVVMFLLIFCSAFFALNQQVSAMVQEYLNFTPTAEFVYDRYTKENQTSIEITEKKNVDKIFFDGIESRDKVNVQLQEGDNKFMFVLTGRGKEVEHEIIITKDTQSPEFTTEFEFKDTKIAQNPLKFSGTLNEPAIVLVNDQECLQVANVNCEYEITDTEEVVVKIIDEAGNTVEHKFKVEIDTAAPEIELSAESPTYQSKVNLKIKGNEELKNVTVNDVAAKKENNKTYNHEVTLNIGENKFTVIAEDLAGNKVSKEINIERKEAPQSNNGGGSYTPPSSGNTGGGNNSGGGSTGGNACSSVSLRLYNVKTPVFAGETQTATVQLTCGNGSGYGGQTVNMSVTYSNGTKRNFSAVTNGSGIATFSFSVENVSGNATMVANYSFAQTSVTFQVN